MLLEELPSPPPSLCSLDSVSSSSFSSSFSHRRVDYAALEKVSRFTLLLAIPVIHAAVACHTVRITDKGPTKGPSIHHLNRHPIHRKEHSIFWDQYDPKASQPTLIDHYTENVEVEGIYSDPPSVCNEDLSSYFSLLTYNKQPDGTLFCMGREETTGYLYTLWVVEKKRTLS